MVSFCNTFLTCFLCIIFAVKVSANVPKIVGGFDANEGQLPYQVSLQYHDRHRCGGTIVNTRHVVTAAHCLLTIGNEKISTEDLKVFVGSTSISGTNGTIHSVENMFLSNTYSRNPIVTSDIAVIRIVERFNFNRFVQNIPLAKDEYTPGASCTISGWGKTHSSHVELSESLRYAVVEILNRADCQSWTSTNIASDMLCAGYFYGEIDQCKGDSGGPLVCNRTLTGVISYGEGCGKVKKPAIYTDVRLHYKWISDIIKSSSSLIVPFAPLMFSIIIFNHCL